MKSNKEEEMERIEARSASTAMRVPLIEWARTNGLRSPVSEDCRHYHDVMEKVDAMGQLVAEPTEENDDAMDA